MENLSGVKGSYPAKSKANTERSLEFRCPQCYKLYVTTSSDIYSSEPQFECEACHALFSFSYPPMNPKAIYTKTLSLPQVGKLSRENSESRDPSEKQKKVADVKTAGKTAVNRSSMSFKMADKNFSNSPELTACVKCGTGNPRGMTECYKCGVVLAKAKIQAQHGGLPSLVKMWQELLHDYENVTKHLAFVDRCEELQALPFALKKYKDVKIAKPQDSMAKQMTNSVVVRVLTSRARSLSRHKHLRWLNSARKLPWQNMFRVSPLVLGFCLIVTSISHITPTNFAGAGAAILSLYLGILYFLKGRINLKDIWISSL